MIGFNKKRILVVVAHPDDEVLGLGGTIHRLIKNYNCIVHTLILGEGITSRSDNRDISKWEKELLIHKKNLENAQKAIGYESVECYDFPDNRFDTVPLLDLVKKIEGKKLEFNPDIIFTHNGTDLNIDHQKTFEAVITSSRPLLHETVNTIISFETPSCTEWMPSTDPGHFVPNYYFEISKEDLDAKIRGMESYDYEKRKFPHPRSPEALQILAQRWGVVISASYAEAFCIVRLINRLNTR